MGEKGFLDLEISRKHEGEKNAESGAEAGALTSASLQPASHISVTSVNEEGSKPGMPASRWSPFVKGEGEMGGGGLFWNPNLCKEPSVPAETERQMWGNTECHLHSTERAVARVLPLPAPCLKQRSPGFRSLMFQSNCSKCPF